MGLVMSLELSFAELRVVGSLMEKDLAAPDYYPLSLNALVSACNQKTSRDPVSNLSEAEVSETLERLLADKVVRERNPAGSRMPKYAHALGDTLGLRFGFDRDQLAVLTVLVLRGAQTSGELRARTARLRGPQASANVESILESLAVHERGRWAERLEREPGRREARWRHLLGESKAGPETGVPETPAEAVLPAGEGSVERVHYLEEVVLTLEQRLDELDARLRKLET